MTWFKKLSVKKEEGLKPGDWVNSYSKGIYRVERIIEEYFEESDPIILPGYSIGDKKPKRTVVSKRLLNSKFKKSISYESCNEVFITPISPSKKENLDAVLKENPSYIDALDNYKIPVLIGIYNMPLQIDDVADLKKMEKLIALIKHGKSFLEIKEEMQKNDLLKLKPKNYGNYLFQLINHDNEYKNKKLIWREAILKKNEK